MKNSRPYYRTAALLGAQPQYVPVRAAPKRATSIHIPWKWLLLLLAVAALSVWLTQAEPWYLMQTDVRVGGTTSLSLAYRTVKASDLWGLHRLLVRPAAAEERILKNVLEVTDAQVRCKFYPASCVIRIVERVPVLLWITEAGTFWVDAEGVVFPAISGREDLPRIYGPLPILRQAETVTMVLEGLQALADLEISADVWEYAPERGLIWTDEVGRRVAFGVGSDMLPRLKAYHFIVGYLDVRGVSPQVVDVRFPEGPTYSIERSW